MINSKYFVGSYGSTDPAPIAELTSAAFMSKMFKDDDPQDWLAVIPLDVVRADLDLINAMNQATTLGAARRSPLVLPLVKEHFDRLAKDGEPPFETLPDETPFDWYEEIGLSWRPDPRLRTAELAPPSVMATFSRPDRAYGMDYEPAPWLPLAQQSQIEESLRALGHDVVHDDTVLDGYLA
ncbi:hypothetical protein AB0C07_28710 [Actinoplanes missouriensis]|uniref:hypothetical protein n=1 Tax=Actinoplanes missouriensis TaxID=1866 RepID=UPI0033F9EC06